MTEEEAKSMGDLFPDLGPEAPVISGIATIVPRRWPPCVACERAGYGRQGVHRAGHRRRERGHDRAGRRIRRHCGHLLHRARIGLKQVQNTLLDKQEVLGYHSFDVDTNVARWPWWALA